MLSRSTTSRLVHPLCRRLSSYTGSTINPSEIAHFTRLSSQWWDERGEVRLLHKMNPPRVAWVRDKIVETREADGETAVEPWKALQGMRMLDVGCGGGLLSESLARLGARTTGIDAAASNIGIARLHAANDIALEPLLDYRHAAVEDMHGEDGRYDAVCSMEVLEHVDGPSEFLRGCAALVKPGGHLFLSTISRTEFARLLTITLAEDVLRLVAPGTHTYSKFIRPSELVAFFQQLGWIGRTYDGHPDRREAEIRGIMYLPWAGEWRLAGRKQSLGTACNYLFWARKPMDNR